MLKIQEIWFIISCFCTFSITSSLGLLDAVIGLDIQLLKKQNTQCNTTHFHCPCGPLTLHIEIPQCTKYHRFRAKCAPCNGMTQDKICPIFQYCIECSTEDGGRCSKCPNDRYGEYCEHKCLCKNGGVCDIKGKCVCSNGYEGQQCERKTACNRPPSVSQPLEAEYRPPESPSTIVYKCQPEYELIGTSVSICSPNLQWSSPAPRCSIKCPVLSAPSNGQIKYNDSKLVQGVSAEASCDKNFKLNGAKVLICQSNGKWDVSVAKCVEMVTCPHPGKISFAKKTILTPELKSGNRFSQGAEVQYACDNGFLHFGADMMFCTENGDWSEDVPSCIKAAKISPDCTTKGSALVGSNGIPIRILCPPECARNIPIWGTSIYRMDSAVCVAAVHSGKISNTGGLVDIINNGAYTHFAGSKAKSVESLSYEDRDESFRFDKVQPFKTTQNSGNCPKGLLPLENSCFYVSNLSLSKKEAEASCKNVGLQLDLPKGFENEEVIAFLQNEGIDRLWPGVLRSNSTVQNETLTAFNPNTDCEVTVVDEYNLSLDITDCKEKLPFVCVHKQGQHRLAHCNDPGDVTGGTFTPVGKVDNVYYVGSSIEYSCETLHYMKGTSKIQCRGNGTWSDEKPICIKVETCDEPPVPFGGFANYLPPTRGQMAQRTGGPPRRTGPRAARLPVGLEARPPYQVSVSPTPPSPEDEIEMPKGRHRIGTRAMYDCESRYYNLVGSRTRRCEKPGQWSGRPPTCIPICGRSDSARSPFIVNGNASDIGQWPWQAGVARYLPDYDLWYVLCGGSLLNERWVITAAHCITYTGTTLPIDPDKFRVYLGKYHRNDSKDDEYVQVRSVREFHIHPDYEPQIFDADIALLQLDAPVQLNTRVQPVCLPTEQGSAAHLSPGSKGVVTGWGSNENGTHSETLQQAVVPVITNEECEEGYEKAGMPLTVTENMFCAGYKEGRVDSCSGDSGGPVVFLDTSTKQRRWMLEGIVSWGSPTGCGNPDQYGGYTKVSKFLDWINLFF